MPMDLEQIARVIIGLGNSEWGVIFGFDEKNQPIMQVNLQTVDGWKIHRFCITNSETHEIKS